MDKLKPKEQRLLDYIYRTIDERGYAPCVRDICNAMGLKSSSTAQMYITRLVEKGYIVKQPGKSRTICRPESEEEGKKYRVPIIGQVAAGIPILATENQEGVLTYSSTRTFEPNKLFALKVKGESMIEIGIMNGDYVIVEQKTTAENGDLVVALVGEEATVKRFFKENGMYRLQPENKTMEPIIVPEVSVLGKVVACIRYYA